MEGQREVNRYYCGRLPSRDKVVEASRKITRKADTKQSSRVQAIKTMTDTNEVLREA